MRNLSRCYAAPNLIYHYVTDHRYLPPTAFLEALRWGPQPDTEDYERMLQKLGLTVNNMAMLYERDPLLAEEFALLQIANRTHNLDKVLGAASKLDWDEDKINRFIEKHQGLWVSKYKLLASTCFRSMPDQPRVDPVGVVA